MTGTLDQLGFDPFFLFAVLFVLQMVIIALLILLNEKYQRLQKSYSVFMKGKNGKDLERSIFSKFRELDDIARIVKENEYHVKKLSRKVKSTYQKSGIVKYDAFQEMGGNLSEEEQECLEKTICQEVYDGREMKNPLKRMRG